MSEISNFIPISRKIFEHRFWCEDREYSRFEAWIDLIQSARFEDGKTYIGNKVMHLKRGQIHASIRFLAKRWGWSKKKVEGFLSLLGSDDMIKKETDKETGHTVVTICNYGTYNIKPESRRQLRTTKGTARGQQGDKTNKENKDNTGKEDRDSLLVARKQKFALTLEPFSKQYPREMLVDFYNYWTEPNKSQTKFRQELEKTWDVARRLDTWARRDRKVIPIGQPKKSKFETNVETFSSLLMPE